MSNNETCLNMRPSLGLWGIAGPTKSFFFPVFCCVQGLCPGAADPSLKLLRWLVQGADAVSEEARF